MRQENFIKKAGQEMYFDKEIARKMIKREENIEHLLTSKIVETILIKELEGKNQLKIADLGAGAHPQRYENFLKIIRERDGKIYWVDQSPIMIKYAKENVSQNFKDLFFWEEKEMVEYLRNNKEKFDGIVLKYSFNYIIPIDLENWLKIIKEALKKEGKVIATLNLFKGGMKERTFNAIYKIDGKLVKENYQPKDGEIIEIEFLKYANDKSPSPETFASTKIIYYSKERILKAAKEANFSKINLFKDWRENKNWLNYFKKSYPDLPLKEKPILLLEK